MRRFVITGVLLAVNIGLAVLWLSAMTAKPFDESKVPYGTSVGEAIRSAGLTDARTAGVNPTYLFVFVNRESLSRFQRRIQYVDDLSARVSGSRLQLVFVTTSPFESLTSIANNARVHYDKDGELHRALHISPSHSHGGLAVVGAGGNVEFKVTGVPSEDSIRRMAEKHAFGQINYRVVPNELLSLFSAGKRLPDVAASPASPASLRVPAFQQGQTIVLFAAACAPCSLNEYLADLGALKNRMAETGGDGHLGVVFDSSFDDTTLAAALTDARLPRLVYRADLRRLVTSPYETRTNDVAMPLVIVMGPDQKIRSSYPLRLL